MGSIQSIGAVDIASLVVLVFFLVLGLIKGFTWQVVRIGALVLGLVLARALSPAFASALERVFSGLKGSQYSKPLAYFIIFVAVLIVGTLIAVLLGKVLKGLRLKSYDSLFGGLLGLVMGAALIVVIVLMLLNLLDEEGDFRRQIEQSKTAEYSAWAVDRASPFIPPELRDKFAETVKKALEDLKKLEQTKDTPPSDGTPPAPEPAPAGEGGR